MIHRHQQEQSRPQPGEQNKYLSRKSNVLKHHRSLSFLLCVTCPERLRKSTPGRYDKKEKITVSRISHKVIQHD
jgi:hypothetical protein